MQECKRFVAVVLVSCLIAAAILGCSDEKSRQAGQNILAKISEARQLTELAIALMSNPVFEVGGEKLTPPFALRKITAEEITAFPPGDAVNPRRWDALDTAYKELSAVLSENADAPAADLALGQSMLSRVRTVRGDYKRAESLVAMRDALAALNAVASSARMMQHQAQTLSELDQLAYVGEKELQDVIAKADAVIADATAEQNKARDAATARKKNIEDINNDSETMVVKAAQLRTQSDNATGPQRLELFDQAAELNKKVNDNSLAISRLEQEIADAQAKAQTFGPALDAAKARKEAAEKLQARQKQAQDYYAQEKNKAVNQRGDTRKTLEASLGQADAAIAKCVDDIKQANDEYVAAATSYSLAESKSNGGILGPDALVGQGIAKSRQAELIAQKLALQTQIPLPLAIAESVYTDKAMQIVPPPTLAKVKGCVAEDPTTLRQAASDLYKDAASSYRRAISLVPSEQRWAMQAQLAAADAGRYDMAVKDSDKKEALDELNKQLSVALSKKENSPYLQDVVRLQAALRKAGIPIEGGAAAPSPAAPAAPSAPATPAAPVGFGAPTTPSTQTGGSGAGATTAPAGSGRSLLGRLGEMFSSTKPATPTTAPTTEPTPEP